MKRKSALLTLAAVLLLAGAIALVFALRGSHERTPHSAPAASHAPTLPHAQPGSSAPAPAPVRDPLPGQGRATVERSQATGGVASGRVIDWLTGAGVAGAELTFTLDRGGGATTVRSREEGVFELAPAAPGAFTLTAVGAPGYLPFAPELQHSTVHVVLAPERAVHGITVFLFLALDYHGKVVDARKVPVAGARVRLLGTPAGEQAIDKLDTEWTSDNAGAFTFHAGDDAVFEAARGNLRGWARLDGDVQLTKQLVIVVTEQAAHDATITGRVVDAAGAPVREVLVRASPTDEKTPRATAFATTAADGAFVLTDLDRGSYDLAAQADGFAPAERAKVPGGTRDVTLVLDAGKPISGRVVDSDREPVPAFTLLVLRRDGAMRDLVVERSIVDANGRFEVHVQAGDYDLVASASGWAQSRPTRATAGARDVELIVTAGATLRGTVVAADGAGPLQYARVMRDSSGGGASAQPANAGTVTRADGTFELTGLPPGPLSVRVGAGGFHPRIEAGLTASDGATLGPITIALARLAPDEQPSVELVGIGVQLAADGDALRIDRVIAGGGAAAAGLVPGDRVVAVDGIPASELGLDGAVAKIRGVAGTTVALTLRRGDTLVPLVVERRKIRA